MGKCSKRIAVIKRSLGSLLLDPTPHSDINILGAAVILTYSSEAQHSARTPGSKGLCPGSHVGCCPGGTRASWKACCNPCLCAPRPLGTGSTTSPREELMLPLLGSLSNLQTQLTNLCYLTVNQFIQITFMKPNKALDSVCLSSS